jgi:hypothetical protein
MLLGCSSVEDFDRFRFEPSVPGSDAAARAEAFDAAAPTEGADAAMVTTDAARAAQSDTGLADAASSPCASTGCDDMDVCTSDACDPSLGCTHHAIDGDGDGYSPGTCLASSALRGHDCDDSSAALHPGATELCDGLDNNCDGLIDEGLPLLQCYPDQDRDGFANLDGRVLSRCACPAGTLSVANPSDRSRHDCWDELSLRGADVFPGQETFFTDGYGASGKTRSFDYDCNGSETPQFGALPAGGCAGLLGLACTNEQGYADPPPACGTTGAYTVCGTAGASCQGTTQTRKQPCH